MSGEDSRRAINIKKGILSTLQVSLPSLSSEVSDGIIVHEVRNFKILHIKDIMYAIMYLVFLIYINGTMQIHLITSYNFLYTFRIFMQIIIF